MNKKRVVIESRPGIAGTAALLPTYAAAFLDMLKKE
jgi:hypothetical protein